MPNFGRVHGLLRSVYLLVLAVFALAWLWLYFDSLHQRRRAERLISNVESIPFSTAGFLEVRELVNRYGGTPVQQFPILRFLPPDLPVTDLKGHVNMPLVRKGPTCTDRDCFFEIWVESLSYKLWLNRRLYLLSSGLAHIGIRPWAVYVAFEIKDGKLWELDTEVTQCTFVQFGTHEGLLPLAYGVTSKSRANAVASGYPNREYTLGFAHVSGLAGRVFQAQLVQTSPLPAQRAFDIHLHCLTTVLHSCSSFSKLAPSAWADYQLEEERRPK
jgi:hypothetical protein